MNQNHESTERTTLDSTDVETLNISVKPKRPRIGIESFVKAWETSDTIEEIANKLGAKKTSILSRASQLRSKGLPLKKLKSQRKSNFLVGMQTLADIRGVKVEELTTKEAPVVNPQ